MKGGSLFIISAPSGAGKTSLVKAVVEQSQQICVSISHTTRAMRYGEQHGREYYFVDSATFESMVTAGAFIEYARVFDHSYGTSKAGVEDLLANGRDVILEIDWQGASQIRSSMPNCQSIFILPPSIEALESRLTSRGQDDATIIARRMRDALSEISHYAEFDYLVINNDFAQALAELQTIFTANRLRLDRQQGQHESLLKSLISGLDTA